MNDITKVGETLNAKETMTSLVIAEVTGKEHKSVMRDIRILSEQVTEKDGYIFVPMSYTDAYNRQQPMYSLGKKECFLLASGYSPLLRAKIIDRWMELENKELNKFPIPQTYSEALLLASNQAKQIEEQQKLIEVKDIQIVEMKPKATYYDKVLSSKDSILISVISKDYGLSAVKLNTMLHDYGVQYKRGGTWLPKSKYASSGYTKTTTSHFYKKDGSVGTRVQTEWTQTGRLFIYDLLKSKGILPLMEI